MNTASTLSILTRWTDRILITLFMTLLWLPTLDSIAHFDHAQARRENRAMATFPQLKPGAHGVQTYVAGLEAYFNDHFGCRKCLVRWGNNLKWAIFKEKNSPNVLAGKNGWLFYADAQVIDHYSGLLQFTPEQLHDWQVLLEKRRDWLARRGIAYVFVVAPDKNTVYSEELPSWLAKIHPQTKLDQFFTYMHEHSTVPTLDLRDVVRTAKTNGPTYLKTDTHWNALGGFAAYQELLKTLARQVPALNLEPLQLTVFTQTNRIQPGGDLVRLLGVSMTESNACVLIPATSLPQFTQQSPPQDHPNDPSFSNNPKGKGSLILFRDSFAGAWAPFLGYHFNQVTYLWHYDLDSAWIERDKPDIVVTEMVERFFNIEDPKKLMAKEALD